MSRTNRLVLRPRIRAVVWTGVTLLLLVAQLWFLRALPYSTSQVQPVSWADASLPPTPSFRIGELEWEVPAYAGLSKLAPLRRQFDKHCRNRFGLESALCVSDVLARQFPNGEPETEFVQSNFDPIDHLKRHTSGEPGHCMNRSAILAGKLLSVGIPARVVQFVPTRGNGHTVVEVWDDNLEWVLVDPTFGGVVSIGGQPASALALVLDPGKTRWLPLGNPPSPPSGLDAEDMRNLYVGLSKASVLYPEPWLYLRVGPRKSYWPYRAFFAHIGAPPFEFGTAQTLLRGSLLLTCLLYAQYALRNFAKILLNGFLRKAAPGWTPSGSRPLNERTPQQKAHS